MMKWQRRGVGTGLALAVLDATVLGRQPRFLGPPVVIGRDPPT